MCRKDPYACTSTPIILRDHKSLSIHGYKSPRLLSTPPQVEYTKYTSPTHYDMPPPISRTIVHDKTAGASSKRLLKWEQRNVKDMWDRKQATYNKKFKYVTNGINWHKLISLCFRTINM